MKSLRSVIIAAAAVPLAVVLVVSAVAGGSETQAAANAGVDLSKLPSLAQAAMPTVTSELAANCPELPAIWLIAQIQAESAWNPRAWADDRNGGTAGLLQINEANWKALGGEPWGVPAHRPPPGDHGIWVTEEHLVRGIELACRNLATASRVVQEHPELGLTPIEGMLACHNVGCGALADGVVPREYIDRITQYAARFAAPAVPGGSPAACGPTPWPDLEAAMTPDGLAVLRCLHQAFPSFATIHTVGSRPAGGDGDHANGRAVDAMLPGDYRSDAAKELGWAAARWAQANHARLGVKYVIFDTAIWSVARADEGWREYEHYAGCTSATCLHYDHVHISVYGQVTQQGSSG